MKPDNYPYPILPDGATVKNCEQKMANIGRPTIFVGCSKESKSIAEKLRSCFPVEEFEVDIWDDGIFGPTRSTGGDMSNMEWLKNFTDIYDFAIFIFVPEDTLISGMRIMKDGSGLLKASVPRHNVVFEYGMFLGRIGARRSFILFDEEVTDFINFFFTDLKENLDDTSTTMEINDQFRIELYSYKGGYKQHVETGMSENVATYDNASIEAAIEKIKSQIKANFDQVEINFLPATALAFGYFNNFVSIFIHSVYLMRAGLPYPIDWLKEKVTEQQVEDWRKIVNNADTIVLKTVIPTFIEGTRQQDFIPELNNNLIRQLPFPGKSRTMHAWVKAGTDVENTKELIVYDIPTTLNSSIDAIELLTPHKDIRQLLKEKELRNFRNAIAYKMKLAEQKTETANVHSLLQIISYDSFLAETTV